MAPEPTLTPSRDNTGGSPPALLTAVVLAALSIVSLSILLAINLSGGTAWAALSWIPMIGLPIAFILMLALVVTAIRRRRHG